MGLLRKNKKSKNSYYYGTAGKNIQDLKAAGGIGDNMSFTYAEALKMLRTKLELIVPGNIKVNGDGSEENSNNCKIIGVTSSVAGEGKSTVSVNLAYTFAEAGYNVCLIEADMRLPTLSKGIGVKATPGLSNVLSGQKSVNEALQKYVSEKKVRIYVISSGDVPATPSELLNSAGMDKLLATSRKAFDYVIVDLPPVTVVTDALTVAPKLDGMVMVVRRDYCDKTSLQDAVNQFQIAGIKPLGIVFTCSDGPSGSSGSAYHKKSYYHSYGAEK